MLNAGFQEWWSRCPASPPGRGSSSMLRLYRFTARISEIRKFTTWINPIRKTVECFLPTAIWHLGRYLVRK
jgi:hypothetical protein